MSKYPVIVGRSETVDFTGIALGVPAKVDSGAFRSAIHATNVKVKTVDGVETLTCTLFGHPCAPIKRSFQTTKFSKVLVRSSNGQEEHRYEVMLRVKIGSKTFNTSFTLTNRSNNLFPVLIGRHALKGRFVINVAVSHVKKQQLLNDFGVKKPRDDEDLED